MSTPESVILLLNSWWITLISKLNSVGTSTHPCFTAALISNFPVRPVSHKTTPAADDFQTHSQSFFVNWVERLLDIYEGNVCSVDDYSLIDHTEKTTIILLCCAHKSKQIFLWFFYDTILKLFIIYIFRFVSTSKKRVVIICGVFTITTG